VGQIYNRWYKTRFRNIKAGWQQELGMPFAGYNKIRDQCRKHIKLLLPMTLATKIRGKACIRDSKCLQAGIPYDNISLLTTV
jgi:hypothetical protein